jgi:hypothetical protein
MLTERAFSFTEENMAYGPAPCDLEEFVKQKAGIYL